MKGDYEPDQFTEADVLSTLQRAGLRFKNGHRYILSQCPTHEDAHPSVQIYKDDWFVNCHAGCGRYHITKAFPELREKNKQSYGASSRTGVNSAQEVKKSRSNMVNYKKFDLMQKWLTMPKIPRSHQFKNIPLEVLDDLGWRWDAEKNSYFIPYFSASKQSIPFAQWRHLSGERRFTFLKDARPTCYGTWNLDNAMLFVVEGTSDAAVLEYCAVPWIALPSASSGELIKPMAKYCADNGIELVYAGDNDAAGDKLREALDEVTPYRIKQPPKKYKDWGDFYEAEGFEIVQDYCNRELFPEQYENLTDVEKVQKVFPGAEELRVVGLPSNKEQSGRPTTLF